MARLLLVSAILGTVTAKMTHFEGSKSACCRPLNTPGVTYGARTYFRRTCGSQCWQPIAALHIQKPYGQVFLTSMLASG